MKFHCVAAACLVLIAGPVLARAKIDFATYEGRPIIEIGDGGSKITKNGIDYWTSGKPPRCFHVIGHVTDRRNEDMDGGHAVGSPRIARLTKQAGGNAVILINQNDVAAGSSGFGAVYGYGWSGLFGSMFTVGGTKTMTAFVVVKYLDLCPEAALVPVVQQPPIAAPAPMPAAAPAIPPAPALQSPKRKSRGGVHCVTCRN